MLHFLEDCTLSPDVQWVDVPTAICRGLGTITQGLYVFRFVNEATTMSSTETRSQRLLCIVKEVL